MNKSTSKSLSDKYSQNLLDHSKQTATDEFKTTSRKLIRKTAETTADLIGKNAMLRLVQGQLQMKQNILDLKEKYQKKDIYLQGKNGKLLIM